MPQLADFKGKIVDAYNETERLSKHAKTWTVEAGSDEHLDLISEEKPLLDRIIAVLIQINNLVESNFPSTDVNEAEEIKGCLHMLHSSVGMLYSHMNVTDFYVNSFQQYLSDLNAEIKQLEEYIEDINDYVLNDDPFLSDDLNHEMNNS